VVFKAKLHVCARGRFSRYAKVYWKDNSSRCRSLLRLISKAGILRCGLHVRFAPQKRPFAVHQRMSAKGQKRLSYLLRCLPRAKPA
jgi:hypothetical protein